MPVAARARSMKARHWAGLLLLGAIAAAGCSGQVEQGAAGTGASSGSTTGAGASGSSSTGIVDGVSAAATTGSGGTGAAPGSGGAGVTGTSSSGAGGGCNDRTPMQHRPTEVSCAPSMPQTACTADSDCTMMPPGFSPIDGTCDNGSCNYNQCAQDSDCPMAATEVCSCQGQTSGYAGASYGSVCIPSNCHVDSDCGPNGFCSPTVSATCGSFYGTQGFYCHTCQDTCVDDTDCGNGQPGNPYCAYDPTVGHWACESGFCAG
jgi:hypothetical protein